MNEHTVTYKHLKDIKPESNQASRSRYIKQKTEEFVQLHSKFKIRKI